MSIRTLRGMRDILPDEIPLWQEVEAKARELFSLYGYEEIRTPLLEELSLFSRSLGDTTNVVEKEMYSFQDKGEKMIALRPEGTASVVRAYIEGGQVVREPVVRYYYIGPMYRRERPQQGRFREFHQIGVEAFGIASPLLDAEVIHMLDLYLKSLGLLDLETEINSLGCPICRPKYHKAFHDFLLQNQAVLCEDCKRRMDKNPLRVLDCKEEDCRKLTEEAPSIQDHLCEVCEKDFDLVLETLGHLGSAYKVNPRIVRGLDYYIKTTFEMTSTQLGSQCAVAGGGRYDGLVRLMGGPNIPGFGFAIGQERLIELMKTGCTVQASKKSVFIAALGERAVREGIQLAEKLRKEGLRADIDYEGKSLKAQMRFADRSKAHYVVILGDDELKKKAVVIRDMTSQNQEEVALNKVIDYLKERKV
ncbi:MAG: histidine--tRNA ligase [Deltaproteobacteria bacterium]|nr:histidine--tRNA ligase [Deltaproteobacteria bacterium]MBI2499879.1 histidine--tRNA ligase [Deltaproteobacteria bacterium]MBI4196278.1 histidine--tRNA ligase [Deltaproteobacteria bacterium]